MQESLAWNSKPAVLQQVQQQGQQARVLAALGSSELPLSYCLSRTLLLPSQPRAPRQHSSQRRTSQSQSQAQSRAFEDIPSGSESQAAPASASVLATAADCTAEVAMFLGDEAAVPSKSSGALPAEHTLGRASSGEELAETSKHHWNDNKATVACSGEGGGRTTGKENIMMATLPARQVPPPKGLWSRLVGW